MSRKGDEAMRILFVAPYVPAFPGAGAQIRMFMFLKYLSKHHEVSLIFPTFAEDDSLTVSQPVRKVCKSVDPIPTLGYFPRAFQGRSRASWRLIRLKGILRGMPFPLNYDLFKAMIVPMRRAMQKVLSTESFDVVHCESLPIGEMMSGLRTPSMTLLSLADVLTLLNYRACRQASGLKRVLPFLEWRRMASYEARMVEKFNACLVSSAADQRFLRRFLPNAKISVVPNGVDTEYLMPMNGEANEDILLFTGLMSYPPNIDAVEFFCLEILPLILSVLPSARLYIVGRGAGPRVTRLAAHHGVHVTGPVEDMRPYFSKASVVVVPLRNGGGTRLKILEALAMGKAVVSTSVGAEGLEVQDGEHLILADSPLHFARETVSLLRDGRRRKILGEQGRQLVETHYSWNFAGGLLASVYEELGNGH